MANQGDQVWMDVLANEVLKASVVLKVFPVQEACLDYKVSVVVMASLVKMECLVEVEQLVSQVQWVLKVLKANVGSQVLKVYLVLKE